MRKELINFIEKEFGSPLLPNEEKELEGFLNLQNAALIERINELESKLTELKEKHKRDVVSSVSFTIKEFNNRLNNTVSDEEIELAAEQFYNKNFKD